MYRHIYNWNVVACDVKKPISLALHAYFIATNHTNVKVDDIVTLTLTLIVAWKSGRIVCAKQFWLAVGPQSL